jgi:hypothetical protein
MLVASGAVTADAPFIWDAWQLSVILRHLACLEAELSIVLKTTFKVVFWRKP